MSVWKKPSTPERIARFLHSLNRDRFRDLHIALNNDNTIISRFNTLSEAFQYACNFRSVSKPANVRTVFNASNQRKQPAESSKKENSSRKHSAKPTEEKSSESKSTEKKEKIWCSFHKNSSHSDAECRAQKKKTSALAKVESKEQPASYNDPNLVILDSGAQLSICFNENLLTNIHQVDPILIGGITGSGLNLFDLGCSVSYMKLVLGRCVRRAVSPALGRSWCVAIILSFPKTNK